MNRRLARLAFPLAAALAAAALGLVGSVLVAGASGGPGIPPDFLDEKDARPVIEAELQAAGLTLAADAETIPGALQKRERVLRYVKDDDVELYLLEETRDPPTNLVLDGYDAQRKIGYEYIGDEDYEAAGGSGGCYHDEDEARETAWHLRLRLRPRADGRRLGVFWAPEVEPHWDKDYTDYQQALAAGVAVAQETLRGQVREFVATLKAEHALE